MFRILFAAAFWLTLPACATAPRVAADDACRITETVLSPILNAANDAGHGVELAERTRLWPESAAAWVRVEAMGFVPAWRSPATDDALRQAYWPVYMELRYQQGLSEADADLQAWEAAYETVGDDRVFLDDAFWSDFYAANRRSARTPCGAALVADHDGALVDPAAPRTETTVRVEPARLALSPDGSRALIAARSVYPALQTGAPRETGTVWLLRRRSDGGWQVLSARRTDGASSS